MYFFNKTAYIFLWKIEMFVWMFEISNESKTVLCFFKNWINMNYLMKIQCIANVSFYIHFRIHKYKVQYLKKSEAAANT